MVPVCRGEESAGAAAGEKRGISSRVDRVVVSTDPEPDGALLISPSATARLLDAIARALAARDRRVLEGVDLGLRSDRGPGPGPSAPRPGDPGIGGSTASADAGDRAR